MHAIYRPQWRPDNSSVSAEMMMMIMLATEDHEAYPILSLNVNLPPVSLRQKCSEKVGVTEACSEWLTNPLVSFVPGFKRSRKGARVLAYARQQQKKGGWIKKKNRGGKRQRWMQGGVCVFVGVKRCASSGACCEITMTVLFFLPARSDRAHSFFAAESDRLKAKHLFLSPSLLSFSLSLVCLVNPGLKCGAVTGA